MGQFIYAIRVEGVGTVDGLYRWAWGRGMLSDPATGDPDSLYQASLLRWPQQVTFGLDFRQGQAKLGSAAYELRRTDLTSSTFYRIRRPVVGRFVGPAANETDATIDLDTAGLTGPLIWEREVVLILAEGPPGSYLVTRGALGTLAQAHGAEASDDVELFSAHSAATLGKRRVELIRVPMASTGYADEEIVWVGVLRGITSPDPGRIRIEADNALSLIRDTMLMRQQWRGKVREIYTAGLALQGDQTEEITQPDAGFGVGSTNIFVCGMKEGAFVVQTTRETLNPGGAVLLVDHQRPFAGSPEYRGDDLPKVGDEVWEVLSSYVDQPSNAAVIANNTLPLAQNPAILVLQLLTTTSGGTNGPYDLGITNLAGNVPAGLVDTAGVLAWALRVIGDEGRDNGQIEALHIGLEGKPEKLSDVIRSVLHPYGATLTQAAGGLISIAQLSDSLETGETATTISQSQVLSIPSQDRRIWGGSDKIVAEYNERPGIGPDRLNVLDGIRLQRIPEGETSRVELDITWAPLRATAIQLATGWLARWHEPIPAVTIQTNNTVDLWPGDTCTLTHTHVYAADGTLGIVAGLFLVESRKEELNESGHRYHYTLLFVGALYDTDPVRIAPNCTIRSYNPAGPFGPTLTVESDDWVGPLPGSPVGSADVEGFQSGQKIQITDEFGVVLDPLDNPAKIGSVGPGDTIVLDVALITAPGPGDIVRVAAYGDAVASQRDEWAFISDAANLLDGTDPPKEYRFA